MNNNKLILFSIGCVLAATSFSLPMYTGAFDNPDFVRCDGCHIQERYEFTRAGVHKTIKCTSCHNVSDFGPDLYSHNATTHECSYCHIEQNAPQFYNDAHNNFSNASNATNIFTGRNEMCVACHSSIELEIEWHRYNGTNMAVSAVNGRWEITHSLFGENVTTNYTNYTDYLNKT